MYNALSFGIAGMGSATIFFWLRLSSVHEKYKSAMTITGLVTFIAAYHYIRIFNSWVDAYEFPAGTDGLSAPPPRPAPEDPRPPLRFLTRACATLADRCAS